MVPPFLAYYGALQRDQTLLQAAYDQIRVYRDALCPHPDATKLWQHVVLGSWADPGHWATGNGWAAAGMLRVFRTLNQSSFAGDLTSQQQDLLTWASDIATATWAYQQPNGALLNVIDNGNSFIDSSSTALMAAVTYRLATYLPSAIQLVQYADSARRLIAQNIDANGWLTQVVDPYSFSVQGMNSPEGQAFVLLMEAAHRDWVAFSDPIQGVVRLFLQPLRIDLLTLFFGSSVA